MLSAAVVIGTSRINSVFKKSPQEDGLLVILAILVLKHFFSC